MFVEYLPEYKIILNTLIYNIFFVMHIAYMYIFLIKTNNHILSLDNINYQRTKNK